MQPETKTFRLRDYFQIAAISVLVALFLRTFILGAYRIPSASMENTLLRGDFVLINKFMYGAKTPGTIPFTNIEIPPVRLPGFVALRRGDLVVFDAQEDVREIETDGAIAYVKRCVALPGDTVAIVNKRVEVNGNIQPTPPLAPASSRAIYPKGYADPRIFPRGTASNEDNYGPIVVPRRGDKLVLDSKTFLQVKGVVEQEGHRIALDEENNVVVDGERCDEYEVRSNYHFMLGDNRDNSLDSRFLGFVSENNIIGKVMMVYWSVDDGNTVRWGRVGKIAH